MVLIAKSLEVHKDGIDSFNFCAILKLSYVKLNYHMIIFFKGILLYMNLEKRKKIIVQCAHLYYQDNLSQSEIAKKVGLSRTYISKLLEEARESGIVEILIHDPFSKASHLETSLCDKYKMQRAFVLPVSDDDPGLSAELSKTAAGYLNTVLRNGDTVGVSWGTTLYEFSKHIIPRRDLKNIRVTQLSGGMTQIRRNIYASEVVTNIGKALNGESCLIPLPAILENADLKSKLMTEKSVQSALQIAEATSIAIFTVGAFNEQSSFLRAHNLTEKEIRELKTKGAVGDICSHIIDSNGRLCDEKYERRIVSLDYGRILNIPTRIGIVSQTYKEQCLKAALNVHCFTALVTNESMAQRLLEH